MRWSRLWFRRPRGRHAAGRGPAKPLPPACLRPAGTSLAPAARAASAADFRRPHLAAQEPAEQPHAATALVGTPAPSAEDVFFAPVIALGFADGVRETLVASPDEAAAILDAARRLLHRAP